MSNANGAYNNILGSGTYTLGKVKLNNVQYVPKVNDNLLSGIELMKEGYKTVLEAGKMIISKKGVRFATETLCPLADMIALEESQGDYMCRSATKMAAQDNILVLHNLLGHCLKNTVKLTFGLTGQTAESLECTICNTTETRQRDVSTVPSNPAAELMESV